MNQTDKKMIKTSVSIIIPTYNNKGILSLVLKSLILQDCKEVYEIIVADDGSTDNTLQEVENIKKKFPRIKYFFQEHNGFRAGHARNLGAANAEGDYLIFLDDDSVVPGGFISNHLTSLKNADVSLGYVCSYGSDRAYDMKTVKNLLNEKNSLNQLPIIEEFRENLFIDPLKNNSETNKRIWWFFVAANFSIRKKLFSEFGFDEDFKGWAEEDVELGYRLFNAGCKIVLDKRCMSFDIRKKQPGMRSMLTKERFVSTTKNQLLLYKKHKNNDVKEYIIDRFEHVPEEFRKDAVLGLEGGSLGNSKMGKRLLLGKNCSNQCEICCLLDKKAEKNFSLEEIKAELDKAKSEGENEITLAGGEVALRKDFLEICDYALELGLRLAIETNGKLFSNDKAIEIISGRKIHFLVHLPFLEPGSELNFRQTLKGIKNLLKLDELLTVSLVISKKNCIYLGSWISILAKSGVKRAIMDFPEAKEGAEELYEREIPSIHDAFPYITKAISSANKLGVEILPNPRVYSYKKDNSLFEGYNEIKPAFKILKSEAKKEASIIIPTYNRREYLKKTLLALFEQDFPKEKYEIVIVDDGSSDNSMEMARALDAVCNLTYIYWPRKEAFLPGQPKNRAGPARNLGVKYSSGEIIIFVDCDIVTDKGFIAAHLESQKKSDIVIGLSVREDSGRDVREEYFAVCNDDLENTDMVTWELAHEGNISFKKEMFNLAGGFSDEFVYWAFEGDELAYKLVRYYNKKISLNRKARGIHLSHPPEYIDKEAWKIGNTYNAELFYKKYLDKEIYYRFFAELKYKQDGIIRECARKELGHLPYSTLLTLCVEETKCKDIFLCKSRPDIVKRIIRNNDNNFKSVFFRLDDVSALSPNLKQIINLFVSENVKINLAVIPYGLTKECADWLISINNKHHGLLCICQHGFKHTENWNNEMPFEFGEGGSYEEQYREIKKGKEIMEETFGEDFFPAFVPPFHSFDKNTIRALEELGFVLFSCSNDKELLQTKIKDVSVDIDPILEYYPNTKMKKEDELLEEFIQVKAAKGKIGIVLHHEKMAYSDFKIIERLIKLLKINKSIFFESFQDIYHNKHLLDVILIQPSYQPHWSLDEPTGVISLASYLNSKGCNARILDFNLMNFSPEYLKNALIFTKPAAVGITLLTRQALEGYKIGNFIKSEFPDITLVYGGVHPTALPFEAIEKGSADMVVAGEGEETFLEIIKAVKEKRLDKSKIKGIAYAEKGKNVLNTQREFISNLDIIPPLDLDLVDIGRYKTTIHTLGCKGIAVHMMTSRGCCYNCSYCNSPSLYKQRVRALSAKRILEELEYNRYTQGIHNIHFHDDIFLFEPERIRELCEEIISKKIDINWICLERVELLIKNANLLGLMKKAGCKGIEIGIESGDSSVLENLNKRQKIEQIRKANSLLLENGLIPMYLLMSYCPGESISTPLNSTLLASELFGVDILKEKNEEKLLEIHSRLMSHMARVSPGSKFYEEAGRQGIMLSRDWSDHHEEIINFIPFSFLNDIPVKREGISREKALGMLAENKKAIRILHEANHYLPENIYRTFSNLNDYIDFAAYVHTLCDGKRTVQEMFDDFSKKYKGIGIDLFCSAIALLSIYGMIFPIKVKITN